MVDVDGLGAEIRSRAVAGTDGYRYLVSWYVDSEGEVRFVEVERMWEIEPVEQENVVSETA